MAMTKKDYELIAEVLRVELVSWNRTDDILARAAVRSVARTLSDRFQEDNPNFDRARFVQAITKWEGVEQS